MTDGEVPVPAGPAPGSPAPVVELPDTHGTPVRVGGPRERPQLVVFLPFAFSRVCGGEVRELAVESPAGVDVVAITCDPLFALRAWAEQETLPFALLSDFWPHGAAARAFGAFEEATGGPTRASFLIGTDGTVAWTVRSPAGVARPVAGYHRAVAELRARSHRGGPQQG